MSVGMIIKKDKSTRNDGDPTRHGPVTRTRTLPGHHCIAGMMVTVRASAATPARPRRRPGSGGGPTVTPAVGSTDHASESSEPES